MKVIILVFSFILLAGGGYYLWRGIGNTSRVPVSSYDECVATGYGVRISEYVMHDVGPAYCETSDGRRFFRGSKWTRDVGGSREVIRLSTPRPRAVVENPLIVKGEARGMWFFEAEFLVKVFDAGGQELGFGIARAESDWMTEEFVPFRATIEFKAPVSDKGTLVLYKNNPSDLRKHDNSLTIPIVFGR